MHTIKKQTTQKQLLLPKSEHLRSLEETKNFIVLLENFKKHAQNEATKQALPAVTTSRLAVEAYEAGVKIETQKKLYNDKLDDFNYRFMPSYNKSVVHMNEFWGVTLEMIDGKLFETLGYNYAEPNSDVLKEMHEKAVSLLETSDDDNLKKLFETFAEFNQMNKEMRDNDEVKLYYFEEFKKLLK